MIKLFKRQKKKRDPGYLSWDEYSEKIKTMDNLAFSQIVREKSVRNMPGCGGK